MTDKSNDLLLQLIEAYEIMQDEGKPWRELEDLATVVQGYDASVADIFEAVKFWFEHKEMITYE